MRRLRWIAVLSFVVTGIVGAPAAHAQTTPSITVNPNTGLVDGNTVTIIGSGFPAASDVYFCQGVIDDTPDQSDCGGPVESERADSGGGFTSSYTVSRFISPPSAAGTTIDCAAAGAPCGIGAAAFFTPNPTVVSERLGFAPQPPVPGDFFGTVTGSDGKPLSGVGVWAYTRTDAYLASFQTVTDAQGNYALNVALPGEYRLTFRPPSGSTLVAEWFDNQQTRSAAKNIGLFPGQFRQANAQLDEGGTVEGSVTDPQGHPAAGVNVWLYGPTNTYVGSYVGTTAADGTYHIANVWDSVSYLARFVPPANSGLAIEWYSNAPLRKNATPFTVLAGATSSHIDAQLEATT